MMILKVVNNFFFRISEGYEELRRYEGKFVDVLAGTMTPEEVMKIVLSIAKEKEQFVK